MSESHAIAPHASKGLPEGVALVPRRFEFRDLQSVPKYWFAGLPVFTHLENAFSIMIPPGERFFIQSVRHYQHVVTDPEMRAQVRAFTEQEGLHMRAHNEFNRSLERYGVDVERENDEAERALRRMQRLLPKKMQLGATAFLEHLTATSAHMLFTEPIIAQVMPEEMLRFWSWHAAEELEHKAVAFDVFKAAGGGYLLRVLSAVASLMLLAGPFRRCVRRMMADDPTHISRKGVTKARQMRRRLAAKHARLLLAYFRPGFHPWQHDDRPLLKAWYENPEGLVEAITPAE